MPLVIFCALTSSTGRVDRLVMSCIWLEDLTYNLFSCFISSLFCSVILLPTTAVLYTACYWTCIQGIIAVSWMYDLLMCIFTVVWFAVVCDIESLLERAEPRRNNVQLSTDLVLNVVALLNDTRSVSKHFLHRGIICSCHWFIGGPGSVNPQTKVLENWENSWQKSGRKKPWTRLLHKQWTSNL